MATGSLYVLKLKGGGQGQNSLNIFHYLQVGGSGNAQQLANAFDTIVKPRILPLIHNSFAFFATEVEDKVLATDFATNVYTSFGTATGEVMPPHDSLSFTYISNRSDARSGGKRFGLLSESVQSNGALVGAAVANVALLEATLETNLVGGGGDAWRPVIYGKRLPLGSTAYFSNPISGVNWLGVTTQNTRKFYTAPGL